VSETLFIPISTVPPAVEVVRGLAQYWGEVKQEYRREEGRMGRGQDEGDSVTGLCGG
jgi:hypothetical protein